MSGDQLHKLLFEFDCLLADFSLYFVFLLVAADEDLFLFMVGPFTLLIIKDCFDFVVVDETVLSLLLTPLG